MPLFEFFIIFFPNKHVPMLLNKEEIISEGLIKDAVPENYCIAGYDLSIGEVITLNNRFNEEYELPPQGMVVVVSCEQFDLRNRSILGYTTVKNTLSRKGIMAVNIGLIDPESTGPLSSILINFGKESVKICKGDLFLRTTFHRFTAFSHNTVGKEVSYRDYVYNRKNEANTYLDPTFLYLDKIKREVVEKARDIAQEQAGQLLADHRNRTEKTLKLYSFLIAALGFILTAFFSALSYYDSKGKPNYNKTYENNVGNLRVDTLRLVIVRDTI